MRPDTHTVALRADLERRIMRRYQSKAEFAEALGRSPSAVSYFFKWLGERHFSLGLLSRWSTALGENREWLHGELEKRGLLL